MPKTPERCRQIREQSRERILREATVYFAKNGFGGTRIAELAAGIGIGQGTLYQYFKSKEDLFTEIFKTIGNEADIRMLRSIWGESLPARHKLCRLSETIVKCINTEDNYPAKAALSARLHLERRLFETHGAGRQSELHRLSAEIIARGQKEGSVVSGSAEELAEWYWGMAYFFSMKKLFDKHSDSASAEMLERILLK